MHLLRTALISSRCYGSSHPALQRASSVIRKHLCVPRFNEFEAVCPTKQLRAGHTRSASDSRFLAESRLPSRALACRPLYASRVSSQALECQNAYACGKERESSKPNGVIRAASPWNLSHLRYAPRSTLCARLLRCTLGRKRGRCGLGVALGVVRVT